MKNTLFKIQKIFKKKSLNNLGKKIWKILGGIGLISSLILTYYAFIPKIAIDLDYSIHKKEAFSIAIKL